MTLDVIGGKADGTVFDEPGALIVSRSIKGDKYIAIEFPPEPKDKNKTVTIYMLAGMTPADAMWIWRERNMKQTEEQWERLCDTARKLIDAPPSVVAEDPENFVAMIDITLAAIEETKVRVGRGGLVLELGAKRKDILEHPERYRETSPRTATAPSKALGKVHARVTKETVVMRGGAGGSNSTTMAPLKDAEAGGALCPECSGVEVHNDNCSQKNLSGGVESRHAGESESHHSSCGPTVKDGLMTARITSGSSAPPAQPDEDDEEDKDDATW